MFKLIRQAFMTLAVLAIITGIAYPLAVTGIAQLIFPKQANGSIISRNGVIAGSSLLGQPFSEPGYFWSRPSATVPYPYNSSLSSGSNLGPSNSDLVKNVQTAANLLRDADPSNTKPVPVDLVTASASGLDPHISLAGAEYQVSRVSKARNIDEGRIRKVVAACTSGSQFGFLGESVVDVLCVNLALNELK